MNNSLLQATAAILNDTQSIRNAVSSINAGHLPAATRLRLRAVFTHCSAIDAILEDALAQPCSSADDMSPREEDTMDHGDVVLSAGVR